MLKTAFFYPSAIAEMSLKNNQIPGLYKTPAALASFYNTELKECSGIMDYEEQMTGGRGTPHI